MLSEAMCLNISGPTFKDEGATIKTIRCLHNLPGGAGVGTPGAVLDVVDYSLAVTRDENTSKVQVSSESKCLATRQRFQRRRIRNSIDLDN